MRKRIQQPSPALVVACIALFVSLGGVGYAAATIGTSDIKNGAVTGKKIKNRTITKKDISKATVSLLKGATGARGPQGAQGLQGSAGAPGISGVERFEEIVNASSGTAKTAIADCPAGQEAIGGGVRVFAAEGLAFVDESIPNGTTGWYGEVHTVNNVAQNFGLRVWVVCANVGP